MNLENIIDQDVKTLSGGELQRVAICIVLGTPADIYLIDEPSGAYLSFFFLAHRPVKSGSGGLTFFRRLFPLLQPTLTRNSVLSPPRSSSGSSSTPRRPPLLSSTILSCPPVSPRSFFHPSFRCASDRFSSLFARSDLADRVIVYSGQPSVEATAGTYVPTPTPPSVDSSSDPC